MPQSTILLQPVDTVKVTIIMDNSLDLLMTGTEVAQRIKLGPHPFERNLPIGEHGFSVLINVKDGERSGTVLFDTGLNPRNFLYNLDALEIDLADTQAIILSHGHPDHAMGLTGLVQRLGNRNLPLLLHPDAYLERKIIFPNGEESFLPPPRKSDLLRENIQVIEEIGPSMLVDNMILVSGEVSRTTSFEKGFATHYAKREHGWEPDPLIHDDQCAIIHVREKGLVIITGCGHSGIINIIRNAQVLTGIQTIYAVIGGFHLTGALFAPIIPATVAALQEINPRYLVPGHCTGWQATHQIARAMPDAFIANSVGTNFVL
ncbi:MAG TPA: MBL fold metallo-hydrolase [Ktedonobacteraceae bacterium]|jgi:7,8-dihydropterin-6-yl-methyl-4-(beta-D-ribofuranosyl)aminobenzene 5'-phosphate synthase|nr:MBL fold metallo-hydrolase [Ktedonobacteraceae bacterium]